MHLALNGLWRIGVRAIPFFSRSASLLRRMLHVASCIFSFSGQRSRRTCANFGAALISIDAVTAAGHLALPASAAGLRVPGAGLSRALTWYHPHWSPNQRHFRIASAVLLRTDWLESFARRHFPSVWLGLRWKRLRASFRRFGLTVSCGTSWPESWRTCSCNQACRRRAMSCDRCGGAKSACRGSLLGRLSNRPVRAAGCAPLAAVRPPREAAHASLESYANFAEHAIGSMKARRACSKRWFDRSCLWGSGVSPATVICLCICSR